MVGNKQFGTNSITEIEPNIGYKKKKSTSRTQLKTNTVKI